MRNNEVVTSQEINIIFLGIIFLKVEDIRANQGCAVLASSAVELPKRASILRAGDIPIHHSVPYNLPYHNKTRKEKRRTTQRGK